MGKRVTETILSFVIAIFGFYLLYINLTDPAHLSVISVVISLILLVMGVVLLFRSGRHDHTRTILPELTHGNNGSTLLSRHKDIISTYEKHSRMRDKLKAIKHMKP